MTNPRPGFDDASTPPSPVSGDPAADGPGRLARAWSRRAPWQRLAAIASLLVSLVAGGITAAQAIGGSDATSSAPDPIASRATGKTSAGDELPDGLASGLWTPDGGEPAAGRSSFPDDPAGPDGAPATEDLRWSPILFKTGFSFFLAFTIGFALRSFVRIAMVGIGLVALAVFGLQYAGLLSVDWAAMGNRWDGLVAWVGPQVSSFRAFLTGQLPSATAATAGLLAGWRSR